MIASTSAELGVEVEDVVRQACDHHSRDVLSSDHGALSVGGCDGAGRDVAGVVGVAVAQPFLEARCADPAQCIRSLITGQQDQRRLAVCVVERALWAGKYSSS
jgi:hypothetical protein